MTSDNDSKDDEEMSTTSLATENKRLHEQLNEYKIRNQKLMADKRAFTRGQRKTKRQIRTDNNWDGEDANISDKVLNWVKNYLFPLYKFLTNDWMEYSEDKTSLSSFVRRKLKINIDNYMDLWNRVICPTINTKYVTIRSNLSNEVRKVYRSKSLHLLFLLCVELYTNNGNHSFICSDNRRSQEGPN